MYRRVVNSNHILNWKSKGLSDESIKSLSPPNNFLDVSLDYLGTKTIVEFSGSCLKQDEITYTHGKIVSIYIVYEISENYHISSYPITENCLFGALIVTITFDIDKYKYSGCYWIW